MSYVLRLVLPDKPGTLGAVATELGKVDADILAMDIVERSPEQAVDDIVVALPSGRQPDVLITAAEAVPGVRVESVRPDPGIAARHREWELVEAIAATPKDAVAILARMLPQVLRASWAMVVRVESTSDSNGGGKTVRLLAGGGGVPNLDGVTPGWAPVDQAGGAGSGGRLGAGRLEGRWHRDGRGAALGSGHRGDCRSPRRPRHAGLRGRPAGAPGGADVRRHWPVAVVDLRRLSRRPPFRRGGGEAGGRGAHERVGRCQPRCASRSFRLT